MVFRRRKKRTTLKNLKELFLPENGWRRAFEYISYRIRRLPDTPHRIALGVSCGVFTSFTPLFGFHFVIGAMLAYLARANVLAAVLGTFFGNPITFPFMVAISVRTGDFVLVKMAELGQSGISDNNWGKEHSFTTYESFRDFVVEIYSEKFVPYLVGGLICGFLAAVVVYILSKPLILTYQRRKRKRKKE